MRDLTGKDAFEIDEGAAVGFCKELGAEGYVCEVSFTTSTAAMRMLAILIIKVAAVLGVTPRRVLCVLATVLMKEDSQTLGKESGGAG